VADDERPVTTGRQCIFCDHAANSHEHLFPDWINKIFVPADIGPVDSIQSQVVVGEEDAATLNTFPAGKLAQHTAKIVCDCCNTGWMAAMEDRASRLLRAAILGQTVRFTNEEQVLIAAWATKTAMVGESIMEYADRFTTDDRTLMRREQRPPLHAMVYLAAYGGPNVGTAYFRSLGQITENGAPITDVYIHTVQVGRLVVQVRGFPVLPLGQNTSLKQVPQSRFIEIPIFPPVESCNWPPNFRFMDEATLGVYTAGGKEPPLPPPPTVLGLPMQPPDGAA
jgi:hypothetical protein